MGLKRITYTAEVTFPPDDTRTLEQLTSAAVLGTDAGIRDQGGTVARIALQGAAQDPDPELPAEELPGTVPPAEPGDPVIP